jgi:transcription elongation GreA/GreB family factor
MSRAFVKEQDADYVEDLPERPVSPHPNDVTDHGLTMINDAVDHARRSLSEAQASGGRDAAARAGRDLRYWVARQATARVVPPPADTAEVGFGSRVTIMRDDGREQSFRIVGEDEADPAQGTISHVSPLARALFGKAVGDVVRAGQGEAEIKAIA